MASKTYNVEVGGSIKSVTVEDTEEKNVYDVTIMGNTFSCEIHEAQPAPSYEVRFVKHTSGLDDFGALTSEVGYQSGETWCNVYDFTGCDRAVINYRYGTDAFGKGAVWNGTKEYDSRELILEHFSEADIQLSTNEQEGTSVNININQEDPFVTIAFTANEDENVSGYGFWIEMEGYKDQP